MDGIDPLAVSHSQQNLTVTVRILAMSELNNLLPTIPIHVNDYISVPIDIYDVIQSKLFQLSIYIFLNHTS